MEKYLLYTRKNISICVVYKYMGLLWQLKFIFNNFNDVLFLYLKQMKKLNNL